MRWCSLSLHLGEKPFTVTESIFLRISSKGSKLSLASTSVESATILSLDGVSILLLRAGVGEGGGLSSRT